jgi:hypothetical protein
MSDNEQVPPVCGSRAVQDSKEYGLLPCPFCGAPGQVLGTANALDEDGDYYIECSDCGVPATSVYSTPEAAVPEWNQRSHPADNAQSAVQSDPFAKDRAEVAEALEVWAKALRHNRRSDSDAVLLDEAATLLRRHPALSSPGQLARLREDPGPLGSAVCYIDNVMNRLGGSEVTLPRAEAEALLAYLDSHPHGFESGGQRGLTEAESEMLRDKYRGMFTEQRGTVTLEQLKKWPDELDETLRAEYPDGTTHFKSGLATAIDRLEEMIEALDGSSLSGRGSTQ